MLVNLWGNDLSSKQKIWLTCERPSKKHFLKVRSNIRIVKLKKEYSDPFYWFFFPEKESPQVYTSRGTPLPFWVVLPTSTCSETYMNFDYTFYLNQKTFFTFELGRFQATLNRTWSKENQDATSVKIARKSSIIIKNHPKSRISSKNIDFCIWFGNTLGDFWATLHVFLDFLDMFFGPNKKKLNSLLPFARKWSRIS